MAKKYDAEDIEVLEGLEPVRKRPGMYIAGTDTPAGLHQLVYEILDNSVDEAMNGHASEINIILHADHSSVTISDNGRGIPVDIHPKYKKSALELILTTLHAGGKFNDNNYKTAGGLHGVGSSVVNALSEELIANVYRDGKKYTQKFKRGHATTKLSSEKSNHKGTGTEIFFRPDPEIFSSITFLPEQLRQTIKTKAYLNPGLKLIFQDKATNESETYNFPDGLSAYLKDQLSKKKHPQVGDECFLIEKTGTEGVDITLAFTWTESPTEDSYSFVNGIYTPDGGSHDVGAKSGIVRAIRNYFSVHDVQTKGLKVTSEDIREGLLLVTSVKLPGGKYQPQFQGQTKSKLNNPEISPLVENVARTFEQTLNEKPSAAQLIINRILLACRARVASREAGETVRRKIGVSHRLTLPGKLADCGSSRAELSELFLVEGDSAGGSTKQGRDRETQAVLPLRGKVLNTISVSTKKVLENTELSNIVSALGCGSADNINIDKLRYNKIIILTDADADGMHIATLLLAFFYQHMRKIIDNGSLYLGKPPLYGIFPKGVEQKKKKETGKPDSKSDTGKRKRNSLHDSALWAYSDEELESTLRKHDLQNPRITRYKGLGEMNPETLWETTLNPKTRTLLQVNVSNAEEATQGLQDLMGNDAKKRYTLIKENAHHAEIDI
jgi:DNA gyrase/topoisomerase IV subunit B